MAEKKEIKFKLDEIPTNGCLIKDDYIVCKSEIGDIRVAKVEGPIKNEDVKKWVAEKD